jgi:hypothetical protein
MKRKRIEGNQETADGMKKVAFKIPLTLFEIQRLDALTGVGRRLKRQAFAREAILAQLDREEHARKEPA